MRRALLVSLILIAAGLTAMSQERLTPVDTAVITHHNTTINGEKITYTATAGTQPVYIDDKIVASLYYTYYTRDITGSRAERPLVISFNGGPGAASVWMHMAYTGPNIVKIDDEGFPVQPYGVRDNPYSILDIADIVYVNPVNTGYSRMVADKEGKMPDSELFFGINADIKYLAAWISDFLSRNNRWLSPKYIIGESYGGTRVSGLAYELQNSQWAYLNGVIMVSPADYKIYESDVPVSSGLNFPYYTAAAWYHGMLPGELQGKDLLEILPESEAFTLNTLIPALTKGGFITDEDKKEVAKKMSYYSGISEKAIMQHNLDLPTRFFWKELLRDKSGHMIGRLDSRYIGIDKTEAGISPDFSIEMSTWNHAFTPAINYYTREVLGFRTDMKYNMSGNVRPWDRSENNVRENLRHAMAANPFLHVMFQGGYYDGACTYFASKYTMWQIDPSGKMRDRLSFKGYRSGHMMYLRREDLEKANDDLREFIKMTQPAGPARYQR
ncbi:MAG: hypothetical protein JW965_05455 [Bacteroidales bacterium]|nr:hypothetical protein [Bacteroidales bacterium]